MRCKFSIILTGVLLLGCGDDNVNTVKNYTFPQDKSMTVGTAIDGYIECAKVDWKDASTKDLKLVSATCEIKKELIEVENKEVQAKYEEALQKAKEEQAQKLEKAIGDVLENTNNLDKESVLKIANEFCEYDISKKDQAPIFPKVICDEEKLNTKAKEIFKEPHSKALGELATKMNFKHLLEDLKFVAQYSKEEPDVRFYNQRPEEIKDKKIQVMFVINTDKTVNVQKIIMHVDGQVKELGRHYMGNFYKR